MPEQIQQNTANVLADLSGLLPTLESLYKDIHSHPELSMEENRTAEIAAQHLRSAGGYGCAAGPRSDRSTLCEQRNC